MMCIVLSCSWSGGILFRRIAAMCLCTSCCSY